MILLRIAIIFKRLALRSDAALSGMPGVPMPRIPDPVALRADLVDLLKARMRLTLDICLSDLGLGEHLFQAGEEVEALFLGDGLVHVAGVVDLVDVGGIEFAEEVAGL
jgi:hypothetical protein